ncbi:MAG: ABC transporter permease, partial [Clostridia bacterium]|nr:ABC transporter permease [Clostridia bacterium]
MNNTELELLKIIADMDGEPQGAFNIRANGSSSARQVTENIDIVTKTDKNGIDIIIKPNTKAEKVHIPVIISETGHTEMVYNDFFIGENADVE